MAATISFAIAVARRCSKSFLIELLLNLCSKCGGGIGYTEAYSAAVIGARAYLATVSVGIINGKTFLLRNLADCFAELDC